MQHLSFNSAIVLQLGSLPACFHLCLVSVTFTGPSTPNKILLERSSLSFCLSFGGGVNVNQLPSQFEIQ